MLRTMGLAKDIKYPPLRAGRDLVSSAADQQARIGHLRVPMEAGNFIRTAFLPVFSALVRVPR